MSEESTHELVIETQEKMIATMAISGMGIQTIAKELKLTRYNVKKTMDKDSFRSLLREIADKMVANAANVWKAAMEDRISEALRVLDKKLKDNDLEAVKIIIKSVGIDKQETAQQSSNLTVVLPDFKQKEVQAEVIET